MGVWTICAWCASQWRSSFGPMRVLFANVRARNEMYIDGDDHLYEPDDVEVIRPTYQD